MLAPPERGYRNAKTATVELQQFALDHGYSLKVTGSTVRCSRSGHATHKVGARSEGPGRRASKTDCPFEAAIVKTATGVKVTIKHGDHNHDIDRDIGIKFWAALTKEEKQVVREMKLRDSSLQVGQVKDTINKVRAQKGLPALKDSKSISNVFQKLKKAAARGSPPRSPPPRDSPPRGSSTRFGPAAAADTTTSAPASPSSSFAAAVPSSSSDVLSPPGSPGLTQALTANLQMEGQLDAVYHELDDLRSQFYDFFASSLVSSIDPAHVARSGFVAMVGAMLLQRERAP